MLNAYGWWKVSQITYIAAIISFTLGGLALASSALLLLTGRKPQTRPVIEHEAITPAQTA